MINATTVVWRKARRSGSASDNCVEVAQMNDGTTAVRDSKDRSGPILRFGSADWCKFLDDLRQAELLR
jgi:uncharacterized protein DUF397